MFVSNVNGSAVPGNTRKMSTNETKSNNALDNRRHCPRCGNRLRLVHVHGHAQCFECSQVIDDCCQGETCEVTT